MLVKPDSTPAFAKREAGGKGYNLYLMSQRGLPVPPWVVLGKSSYLEFIEGTGLAPRLDGIIARVQAGTATPAAAAREVEALLTATPLPESIRRLAREAYALLGSAGRFAVRSSAADEDGMQHSFAGQLSSFLYVEGLADIERYLRLCWASGFSERAIAYRLQAGLDLTQVRVAVVLQRMLDPEKSGVLFTCDPVEGRIDRYLISAVYGVGEGLVGGGLDADSFWLTASDGSLARQQLAHKTEAFRRKASGEAGPQAIDELLRDKATLSDAELRHLHELGRKVAASYPTPQDVEWAIADGKVHLLQTRPVTTLERNLTGYLNLWDNSNIIESYGGITLPLSFTFARRNYHNVYIQFCEVLKVPHDVVKEMDPYLGNMLGLIHGRVYYNLYNWYKLVGVLPGFRQNMAFMETMMGVSETLGDEVAKRIQPHPSWDTPLGKWRKVRTGLSFLYYHFAIQGVVARFQREFHRDYLAYRNRDYASMRADEINQTYIEMERVMLGRWQAPIINDFLCMVHFGLLKRLTNKWLAGLDSTLQNDLLAGEGNLESAEPTKTLLVMARDAASNPELRHLIETTPAADALEALRQSPHHEFHARVESYIERFGFRCMNEMKLEEIDLYTDPGYLFVCLRNYLKSGSIDLHAIEQREQQLRSQAELKVRQHLSGARRIVYNWSLRHARKAVRNRENTRFARTRIYGVARTQFTAIGEELAARGILRQPRDVFYLEIEELFGIFDGTLTTLDLAGLVALRKANYAAYETVEPKARMMSRGPVYWGNGLLLSDDPEAAPQVPADLDADLVGLPCCPGIVEGIVKVVGSPQDDLELNGEILVAPRTDPGWVPLYPAASGLLVERGSLLSHSAIVAREMGLPAIVSIPGLTKKLRTGMRIRMDGKAGTIKILEQD